MKKIKSLHCSININRSITKNLFITILFFQLINCFVSHICYAENIIEGSYCYTYGDNESLNSAKELAKTLAIRDAIESYEIIIESTAMIKNTVLTNDIIQSISSGYLRNINVIKETIKGLDRRTVCIEVNAEIVPNELKSFIQQKLTKKKQINESIGIANNGTIKILSARDDTERTNCITVSVQLLRNFRYPIKKSAIPHLTVFADFFNSNGDHICNTMTYIIGNSNNNSINSLFLKGMVKVFNICFPLTGVTPNKFKSYKVWLYDNN